jgi:hypothetical protein
MATFKEYLRAGYSCLWINTLEPARAQQTLGMIALEVSPNAVPIRWDLAQGSVNLATGTITACPSPVEALKQAAKAPEGTVAFLHNFHRLLGSLEVVQTIQNLVPTLKEKGNCIVVLAPSAEKLPEELARVFTTLEFSLPTSEDLRQVASKIGEPYNLVPPAESNGLVDAALGLTDMEAEDAFALALVETGGFDAAVVAKEKAGALLRQSKITLELYPERFADLGGLARLKEYTLRTARSPLSLGILLLGVSGTGKSSFARALGNELGIPTLSLDFGRMMSSLVGSSEATIREALKAVDAMGRCVLFLDELEKGLAGAGSSGQLDSGVKAGVAGTFLKWLSDRKPGRAYVIATTNDISKLPPEYVGSQRWNAVFFLDLPTSEEKAAIWAIWAKRLLGLSPEDLAKVEMPSDQEWTGADIRKCCETSAMMGSLLPEAAEYVVPLARSMKEQIQALRDWASGRAIPASLAEEQPVSGRKLTLGRVEKARD